MPNFEQFDEAQRKIIHFSTTQSWSQSDVLTMIYFWLERLFIRRENKNSFQRQTNQNNSVSQCYTVTTHFLLKWRSLNAITNLVSWFGRILNTVYYTAELVPDRIENGVIVLRIYFSMQRRAFTLFFIIRSYSSISHCWCYVCDLYYKNNNAVNYTTSGLFLFSNFLASD